MSPSSPHAAIDHLWVEETGDGPPVLLVHGLGGTSTYYEPLTRALASSHRVIRFDLAGHGRSAIGPSGPPSIESWSDDAMAVLDSLAAERISVVGHSMGTLVVQHLAATRPGRVDKIVLLGPVRPQPEPAQAATRERAAKVRAGGMRTVSDVIVAAALADSVKENHPEVVGFVRELLLGQDPEGYAMGCEALAAAEGTDPLAIEAEALLITGSDDAISPPELVVEMAAALPRAEAEILDSCGHWSALERGREVERLVQAFL